jgi:hypothetical protein
MMTPKRVHSITNPTKERLIELFLFMQRQCDSEKGPAVRALLSLMTLLPPKRLALNLRIMLERMTTLQIRNVLEDGLRDEEKAALLELELRGASDELLGVAHGLLNVHERWFLLKSVGSKFRTASESSMEFLQSSDLLKDLLGDT